MLPFVHSQTDLRRTIGILQQWQALLAPNGSMQATTITMADIQAGTIALQQTFGATATLETIIQQLVAEDLRVQIERRQQVCGDLLRVA